MAIQYEFDAATGFSSARSLGLFLNDFVLDFKPLEQKMDDVDVELQQDIMELESMGEMSTGGHGSETPLLSVVAGPGGREGG
jgi:hypothetical protein